MFRADRQVNIKTTHFKLLFEKYFPSLCIFANNIVKDMESSKDLVQEVFYKVWKSTHSFENENMFRAYIYTATKNTCIDFLKNNKKISQEYIENAHTKHLLEDDFSNEIIREETYRLLDEAIENLPSKSRKILQLALFGYSNYEIADELNISINTVKTQKLLAYRKIRKHFDNQFVTLIIGTIINFYN